MKLSSAPEKPSKKARVVASMEGATARDRGAARMMDAFGLRIIR
jgi:hypothetical protein